MTKTKNHPFFSIITPAYNAESFLARCVRSVVEQSFADLEMIVVDDGSQDRTPQICDAFAETDNRVKVVHTVNMGVSHAKNTGLDIATGKWVIFLDSDDYMEDGCLEQLSLCINDDVTHYVYGYNIFTKNQYFVVDFAPYETVDTLAAIEHMDTTFHNSMGYVCHCVFLNDVIQSKHIRFPEGIQFGEDAAFAWHYAVYSTKTRFLPIIGMSVCDVNACSLTKKKIDPIKYGKLMTHVMDLISMVQARHGNTVYLQRYVFTRILKTVFLAENNEEAFKHMQQQIAKLASLALPMIHDVEQKRLMSEWATKNEDYAQLYKLSHAAYDKAAKKMKKNILRQRIIDKLRNVFCRKQQRNLEMP